MVRHVNERLYIGPAHNEVVVSLGRAFGARAGSTKPNVSLQVTRRRRHDASAVFDWVSYAVDSDFNARFEIPDEFIAGDVARGFYDAKVMVGDCHVSDIEIVKAPSYVVNTARSIQDRCHGETKWVEPDCDDDVECGCPCAGNVQSPCDCAHQVRDNCPTCYNETRVAKIDIKAGYMDWDEKEPVELTCAEKEEAVCVQEQNQEQPPISFVQQSNSIEGYIDD